MLMPTLKPLRLVRKRKSNSGFTLIEVLVTLGIIASLLVAGAMALRSAFDANIKSAALHLSSTLRYLSSKSVTDKLYLRIVYNFDERSYQVEQSSEPFVIETNTPQENEKKKDDQQQFVVIEQGSLKPVVFPRGIFFKDISVSFYPDKIEKGVAYTYFFPDGFATPTVINLRDEDDQVHYSIDLSPFSGQVKVESNYHEMER